MSYLSTKKKLHLMAKEDVDARYLLRWNRFHNEILADIETLRQQDELIDASFYCEGEMIGVHKLIIFAASNVLKDMLSRAPSKNPIIFISDIRLDILKALLTYIYLGEVQVDKSDLLDFMRAAEVFKVKGLQNEENVYQIDDPISFEESKSQPSSKKQKVVHVSSKSSKQSTTETQADQDIAMENVFEISEMSLATTSEAVNETLTTLKTFLLGNDGGPAIFDEFNINGLLTEERKEDLLNLVCSYVQETTNMSTYTKASRETVAEAVLGLFPSTFAESYEQLGEIIRRRIGNSVSSKNHSSRDQFYPLVDMWDETASGGASETKPNITQELSSNKLFKLAEKWKYDFFSCREANIMNIQEVLDNSSTTVCIEYDEANKMVARICCVVCGRPIRIGYHRHSTKNGETYNFSNTNYFHHLKMHSTIRGGGRSRSGVKIDGRRSPKKESGDSV